jgi:hypothetical protein
MMVATGCGHDDWESLLAAHDEARDAVGKWWRGIAAQP